MFYFLTFIIGICIGATIANLYLYLNSGYGLFRLDPVDEIEEPGEYTVTVRVAANQNLLDKKRIILKKEIRG